MRLKLQLYLSIHVYTNFTLVSDGYVVYYDCNTFHLFHVWDNVIARERYMT